MLRASWGPQAGIAFSAVATSKNGPYGLGTVCLPTKHKEPNAEQAAQRTQQLPEGDLVVIDNDKPLTLDFTVVEKKMSAQLQLRLS